MAVLWALLSAMCGAVNVLTQRVSSRSGPSGSAWLLARYLLRQPLWLLGVAAAGGALVFQASALRHGNLSVVQPLLVSELVFALVIRRVWLHQHVRWATWAGAGVTCVGLAVFLVAAEPRGGRPSPTASAWATSVAALVGATVVLVIFGGRGSPVRRAALYGVGTAVAGTLAATFLKTATAILADSGPLGALTSWSLYAALTSGIAGALLFQATVHVGPIRVSQPLMVVVNPMVSIWLSVRLFAEYFTDDVVVLAVAAGSFAAIVVGVWLLTSTAPQQEARAVGGDAQSAIDSPAK